MSLADRLKWDARYQERGKEVVLEPSPFLLSLREQLPASGKALDLAGGSGRHALWLAEQGLRVTLCDVSKVGLEMGRAEAERRGLQLETLLFDAGEGEIPAGPWDLIVVFHFLWRPLFEAVPKLLAPGGLFVFVQPTRSNLQRNPHPGARYLLEDGELPRLLRGVEPIFYEEGWFEEGRHEARLIARAPGSPLPALP